MSNEPMVVPVVPSKVKVFVRRLGSSVVLWAVVIGALFSGNRFISDYVFLAIMMLLSVAGLIEFYDMARKRELVCFKGWGIAGGVLLTLGIFLHCTGKLGIDDSPARVNDFETCFLILFVLGLCVRQIGRAHV